MVGNLEDRTSLHPGLNTHTRSRQASADREHGGLRHMSSCRLNSGYMRHCNMISPIQSRSCSSHGLF
jgi:hypothetical protein